MKLFLIVFFTTYCSWVNAGVVVLTNDDRINGQLMRLDGEHVVWKTANFGEQWIKRTTDKQAGREVLRDVGVGSASLPFLVDIFNDS